ncbi:hypothetical protein CEXT_229341 [Caerostris extrusa]|uniref:Uncharacterized protein n=1 Tax=Caerostris extrusa TaxID=172846 RepID=A0AAV4Y024_CAEEX|nr:hypothetical protein CEXT_229341 [Caerostris extrusa]
MPYHERSHPKLEMPMHLVSVMACLGVPQRVLCGLAIEGSPETTADCNKSTTEIKDQVFFSSLLYKQQIFCSLCFRLKCVIKVTAVEHKAINMVILKGVSLMGPNCVRDRLQCLQS